jgi:DNA-binding CsgD family transcriptional regulator
VPKRRRSFVDDLMRPIEMDQQLSISYRIDGRDYRAFVLARGGRDFTDDDVVVASYIQRGLLALDAQTSLLARLGEGADPGRAATVASLTGRELAVLQLLVDGCPTRVIGRRLACSPRTVEKHLEHVYRKLEVKDRVNAVRIALAWGLREAPDPVRPPTTARVLRGA